MLSVDLNCDMGEGFENDAAIMPHISSVNIACGYHAGDEETMQRTVAHALKYKLAIGAHPSYKDRKNFGRTDMTLPLNEVYEIMSAQISLLDTVIKTHGAKLHHVKPHGALYNMAAKNRLLADVICKAIFDFDSTLIVYGLSGSLLIESATSMALDSCSEVFGDRSYQEDGSLTSRNSPGALITDANRAAGQVLDMVQKGKIKSLSGKDVSLLAETICIHGDGSSAVDFVKKIQSVLVAHNIAIQAPRKR